MAQYPKKRNSHRFALTIDPNRTLRRTRTAAPARIRPKNIAASSGLPSRYDSAVCACCPWNQLENGREAKIANHIATIQTACETHLERSEEHTSELQSLRHLVCRLLLEKKKKKNKE